MKPGDLVKTDPFLVREGMFYDLLSGDLYSRGVTCGVNLTSWG